MNEATDQALPVAAESSGAEIAYRIGNALYLNITNACTLACGFCPKTQGDYTVKGHQLHLSHQPSFEEVVEAIGDPTMYEEVVFCGYGEPTLRLALLKRVAAWLKERGVRVRLNTDGLANLVHRRNVVLELRGLVDTVSVSLNAQNEALYNEHCQPSRAGAYAACKAFIRAAVAQLPEVVVTALDGLPGVDIEECRRIAEQELGARFRRRVYGLVG
ncbi:MAG: hydrolase TatD [Deltaproteobacteria bacterium]|nr:hydrolase TatD [Deltaproteobacteria bacterium]